MRIATALVLGVTAIGCAAGNKDATTPSDNDAATDSGAHDSSLADTALPDAPKDSSTDVRDAVAEAEAAADSATDGAAEADAVAEADAGTDGEAEADAEAGTDADAGSDVPADSPPDAATGYRHTISIDGTNDFTTASERFVTTSGAASGYYAYVTWDATNLYVGYDGGDVASGSATKWIFAYLDVDPGAGTGATSGVKYNHQQPNFPAGFGAEYYLRWKADDTFTTLESYSAGAWSTIATSTLAHSRSGTYVEFAIPLAALGSPSTLGVITFWLNELGGGEWSYAGIYAANFTDGYYAAGIPITHYLQADFASPLAPNDPSNEK